MKVHVLVNDWLTYRACFVCAYRKCTYSLRAPVYIHIHREVTREQEWCSTALKNYNFLSISRMLSLVLNYCIAGIVRRRKLSRIHGKWDNAEKTFVDCSFVLPTIHRAFKHLLRKFSLVQNSEICESFLP